MDNNNTEIDGFFGGDLEELIKDVEAENDGEGTNIKVGSNHNNFDKTLTYSISDNVRELAVKKSLVPKDFKDAKFDADNLKEKLSKMINGSIYRVENFNDYIGICCKILSNLRLGKLPERSMLIGAPNDFDKRTFVNECIITMEEKGMKTVPYVSLFELSELRMSEEHRVLNSFFYKEVKKSQSDIDGYTYLNPMTADFIKKPIDITGNYSWSEYINSDCLFCYLSDVMVRQSESRVLYGILKTRSIKRLPTIVMMATSLEPYLRDKKLKEQVWDEILDTGSGYGDIYGRLVHKSTYKVRRNLIGEREDMYNA